jgi:hypothetical protein
MRHMRLVAATRAESAGWAARAITTSVLGKVSRRSPHTWTLFDRRYGRQRVAPAAWLGALSADGVWLS